MSVELSLKTLLAAVLVVSGCTSLKRAPEKNLNSDPEVVYAATTIPVSRLEIKVIDNQKKVIKAQPVLEKTAKNEKSVNSQKMTPQPYFGMQYLAETVYFGNGSVTLTKADKAKIKQIAAKVKAKNARISVYGFASSRTKDTDLASHKLINFQLSLQRAENVAQALVSYGVNADNISVEALSDSKPVYLEVMPKGESLNRRVEIFAAY